MSSPPTSAATSAGASPPPARLDTLALSGFGGIRQAKFTFAPSLTVVLGPNDVGKSTLYRAIESALLTSTTLKRGTLPEKAMRQNIPIGSDHARLSLTLAGGSLKIEKTWGQNPATQLTLENGTVLGSTDKAEAYLEKNLPALPPIIRSVLLAGQNTLEHTLDQLRAHPEALHSLGDLLRTVIDQTDGISIDRLKARVDQEIQNLCDYWVMETQRPEKDRGIENPWARPGEILKAYYAGQTFKAQLTRSLATETALGESTRDLDTQQLRLKELRKWLDAVEPELARLTRLRELERARTQTAESEARLKTDLGAWMQAEIALRDLPRALTDVDGRAAALRKELGDAQATQASQAIQDRLAQLHALDKEFEAQRKQLHPEWSTDLEKTIRQLNTAETERERTKLMLAGAALRAQFERPPQALGLLKLQASDLLGDKGSRSLAAGDSWTIDASGEIRIETADFSLTVSSAEKRLGELRATLERTEKALGDARQALPADVRAWSLPELDAWSQSQTLVMSTLREKQNLEKSLLAQGPLFTRSELEAAARSAGQSSAQAPRPAPDIARELEVASQELGRLHSQIQQHQALVETLKARHRAARSEDLLTPLATLTSELTQFTKERDALAPKSTTPTSGDDLLLEFERRRTEWLKLNETLPVLIRRVAELRAELPEQSSQEIERQLREARERYEALVRRARALLKIRAEIYALESGTTPRFAALEAELSRDFAAISGGKYPNLQLEDSLPAEFVRSDGVKIPFAWLSAGTRDAAALVLRLAMTRWFLPNGGAFIVLDDPLVNLDPERQRLMAQRIREFSKKTQVIVLTCHPSHAEILDAEHVIKLDRLDQLDRLESLKFAQGAQ